MSERHDSELNVSEVAAMATLGKSLRAQLDVAAERPAYFWSRQQRRIRERIADRPMPLRWPVATMAALAVVSFALLTIKAPVPPPATSSQAVDADDLLLRDIQHSLAHRGPESLMPASVLVQEMTARSKHSQERND